MKSWAILFSLLSLNFPAHAATDPFKIRLKTNHQLTLLNHGLSSLEARLQMIEKAQKTIDVEYFIYNLDKSGRIFSQALIKKAREGVKVRMLLDYFMIKSEFSPFFAYEMEKNGIEVRYFNTTSSLNAFNGQYRNHRKVLLIDGKEALTGGRNIADEYFDLREDYNFLDRDVIIKGEIVSSIQETYNKVWNAEVSVKVDREEKPRANDNGFMSAEGNFNEDLYLRYLTAFNKKADKATEFLSVMDEDLLDKIRAKGKEELEKEYTGFCDNITFNSEYPIVGKKNRSERIIKHEIAERIENARESILFDSPYFIDDSESKAPLVDALKKNVKVTLLTNSLNSTDAIYVYANFDSSIKTWIKRGLEPYIFVGNLLENYPILDDKIGKARFGIHAKTFVFDKKDVVIGTYNFDPRSANLNVEMTIACNDNPDFARAVTEDIEQRIKGSLLLDSNKSVEEYELINTSFWKKVGYYLTKVPANLLESML